MGIQFAVAPGIILLCDYSRGGFQAPEMVKRRPAIVISPRLRHRDGLCTVVPVSSIESDAENMWCASSSIRAYRSPSPMR
jgi:mRNA interferase MazF